MQSVLAEQGRGDAWREIKAGPNAGYDETDELDLSGLELLIALPSSPGNVVPVHISFDVNPTSRQLIENMIEMGLMEHLIQTGARFYQAGCNGCNGMGQASATGKISLRTVPRNFPGRSGTVEDQVYLCSPETATASALTGVITDPRTLNMAYPHFSPPRELKINTALLVRPESGDGDFEPEKGPNIKPLPVFDALPDRLEGPVLLKMGIDISTDEIMPAGAAVLPLLFENPGDWENIHPGDEMRLDNLRTVLPAGRGLRLENKTRRDSYALVHNLSGRQLQIMLAGGLINTIRRQY